MSSSSSSNIRKRSYNGTTTATASSSSTVVRVAKRGKPDNSMEVEDSYYPPGKPYVVTPPVAGVDESAFKESLVSLHRLLHAMENDDDLNEQNSALTWQTILSRADMVKTLWRSVSLGLKETGAEDQARSLENRVNNVCQKAVKMAEALKKENEKIDQKVSTRQALNKLFPTEAEEYGKNSKSQEETWGFSSEYNDKGNEITEENDDGETKVSDVVSPSNQIASRPSTRDQVQDLQESQREQIEAAISLMASQLKSETIRIHDALKEQTSKLDNMEDLATENVAQVSEVVQGVSENLSRGWTRSFGTWTLLIVLVGVFAFCLVTIMTVRKRPGACLFFCPKPPTEFCRTLPNGRKECISDPRRHVEEYKDTNDWSSFGTEHETPGEQECELGINGECIANGMDDPAAIKSENIPTSATGWDEAGSAKEQAQHREQEDIPPPLTDEADQGYFAGHAASSDPVGGEGAKTIVPPPLIENEGRSLNNRAESVHTDTRISLPTEKEENQVKNDPAVSGFDRLNMDRVETQVPHPIEKENRQDSGFSGSASLNPPPLGRRGDLDDSVFGSIVQDPPSFRNDGPNAMGDTGVFGQQARASVVQADVPPLYNGKPFSPRDVRKAAAGGEVDLLRGLLEQKPDWVDKSDKNGWTALHLAARAGHTDVVRVLVHEAKCDANQRANSGVTALDVALERLGEMHPIVGLLTQVQV